MDNELEGIALDKAVAKALGLEPGADYSTSGIDLGSLIERYRITLVAHEEYKGKRWSASVGEYGHYIDEMLPFSFDHGGIDGANGPTALIAAMRALVLSKTLNAEALRQGPARDPINNPAGGCPVDRMVRFLVNGEEANEVPLLREDK